MPYEVANEAKTSIAIRRPKGSVGLSQKIQIARLLTKNAYAPPFAALILAGLMVWVLRDTVPALHLALWSAALFSAYALRLALFLNPRSYTHIFKIPFLTLFTVLTLYSGLIWGSVGIFFFDAILVQQQTLLAFCLGGLIAGSVVSYASWLPAFLAFAVPTLTPLTAQLLLHESEEQLVMGVMLLVYGITLTVMARTINRFLVQSLSLQSALGNSEGRFRGVFETSPAGMILMQLDGQIIMVNRAFGQLLGYPVESLAGQNWRDITHPEDCQAIELLDERILSGSLPDLLVEKRYLHKDGHTVWTDVATSLIDNPDEEQSYLLRQVFDITALKSVERMKNEFVSTVSHELRTPLTSIEGALTLVLGGVAGEIPERAREMTVLARKNSTRLIELVNDLLDIDQMESNDLPLAFGLVDLSSLVIDTIERNQGLASAAGVGLRLEATEQSARVVGDARRLGQVLTNLLSNAVKFSPRSGDVVVRLERLGTRLRVSLSDQGSGIPQEFRATIFNRFSQADASDTRAKGGAGLGLNISRAIMDKHAGNLDFVSTPGQGATFYFDLQEWKGTEPIKNAIEKLRSSGLRPGR